MEDSSADSVDETLNLHTHPDPKSLVLEFSEDDTSSASSSDDEEMDVLSDNDDMMYYERAIQEIATGDSYICMICTVEMDYTCKMYACKKCYRVFDYDCIREWALKSTEKTKERIWKCPNCYHVNKKVPTKNRATCWCGKVVNPEKNPLNPNSCGQTCNVPICIHGCSKICHLGPHPECLRTITMKCDCGKHEKQISCFQSKSQSGRRNRFSCEEECGLPLSCGIHTCKKKCHSGLCGSCPELLEINEEKGATIKCYCGLETRKSFPCKDVKIPIKLSRDVEGNKWVGVFSCNKIRNVEFSCQKHSFVESCVAPPTILGTKQCPFSPNLLKTCPCGRTALNALSKPRLNCIDPVLTCEARCNKPLKCGKHRCPYTCHNGPCMDPCIQIDKKPCSCHQSTFLIPCQFEGEPHCNIKCESLMSCRRHRCTERCCSGRSLAEKRKKTLFRSRDINDETLVEAQHVCLKECNLMLSCGKHKCQRKCHPGKCPPCLESDSNDLVCPCGKTVVEAPVRCGTNLPPCLFPCIKVVRNESTCGHPPVPHSCHPLDQSCPPCTATVFKSCKCGKRDKVRTVCFQKDVSCGQICGLPLLICHHKCQKTCHPNGECQIKCKQVCRKKRLNCVHECLKPCHGLTECPDTPCPVSTKISCPCGRRESYVTCSATSTIDSAALITRLDCDEECEVVKRHRELKEAFGIVEKQETEDLETQRLQTFAQVATTYDDLQLPYTEPALMTYTKQPNWCEQIEEFLIKFMDDNSRPSLHFKPMRPPQRYFIHEVAKAFNLYAESQDREPKRSVFIKKKDDGTSLKPALRLSDVLPVYQNFKKLEKERKAKEFEARTTARLMNIALDGTMEEQKKFENNGLIIRKLSHGITLEFLSEFFNKFFKSTLIKNPQYLIIENNALIYPENHNEITQGVYNDLDMLVGHFNVIVKEELIGDSVEMCNIENELPGERLETPRLETPGLETLGMEDAE